MLKIHWFLPTGGDSRDVSPDPDGMPVRPPSLQYLAQVAQACDQLGFDAVLTPCGTGCEDAWIATAALIPLTRRLRFLVALRPGETPSWPSSMGLGPRGERGHGLPSLPNEPNTVHFLTSRLPAYLG